MKEIHFNIRAAFFGLMLFFSTLAVNTKAQTVSARLQKAYTEFEKDAQLKYASHSLYVVELATGKPVFAKNIRQGLAPASTQKVVTAAAAYALLGEPFQYETAIGFNEDTRRLLIQSSGDPSFGSVRYTSTRPERIIGLVTDSFELKAVRGLKDWAVIPPGKNADHQTVPDGWIIQDIGNYYGAAAMPLNWQENQYEILLKSTSRIGEPVEIINSDKLPAALLDINNQLRSAAAGSGDNAYIYLPLSGNTYLLKGTIPVNQSRFSISGAITEGAKYFFETLTPALESKGVVLENSMQAAEGKNTGDRRFTVVARFKSPGLDSLSYWFLRKSINLYGEAFIKTIGENKGAGWSADEGLAVLRRFWAQQKIGSFSLRMQDGSGLSPQNRVTTEALVQVLQYARGQKWFDSYFAGFPIYNGMQMKSGTISGVKGFCGYHKSKDGKEYVFAFLVNNHSGSSSVLVRKMYEVLDQIKTP